MVVILLEKSIPGFHNEAGGHRIQRVPDTEKRGRVHSSTITCAVLDTAVSKTSYDSRSESDFEYRWFSGTGCGGSRRNKVQSCLELTHIPTGVSQHANGRSRETNSQQAMSSLIEKLDALKYQGNADETNVVRSKQIGLAMRADKKRTYRFQDNSITDHTTGKQTSCKSFMRGDIERLW